MTDTSVAVTPVVTMPVHREGPDQFAFIIERYLRDPSVDVQKLEGMVALQERMMRWKAESEWNAAMAEAQSKMHAVANDSGNTSTKSRYASYAAIDAALRPIYSEHGFSLSFNTEESTRGPDSIRILCDVSKGGHSRRYQIDMPADGKGARGSDVMTKTHATGSAVSYGMRYLLKMIFNVATGEADDDGNAAGRGARVENRRPPPPAPNPMPPYDPKTGEFTESPSPPRSAATTAPPPATQDGGAVPDEEDDEGETNRLIMLDSQLEEAAEKGTRALKDLWLTLGTQDRLNLKGALDARHKPRAEAVDAAKPGHE